MYSYGTYEILDLSITAGTHLFEIENQNLTCDEWHLSSEQLFDGLTQIVDGENGGRSRRMPCVCSNGHFGAANVLTRDLCFRCRYCCERLCFPLQISALETEATVHIIGAGEDLTTVQSHAH